MTEYDWLKPGQEIFEEEIVETSFKPYLETWSPVRFKKSVADTLYKVQESLPFPIKIVDNTVRKDVKIAAQEQYFKDLAQWKEQGFWTTAGGKRTEKEPDYQAGEKSFHIYGQAFDLNQEDPNMQNPILWEALRKAGFSQPRPEEEWYHWSIGEVTAKNTGGPVTQPLYSDRRYII
jgi:hypothetical protein